jgi:hypothetical protein
MHKLDTIAPAPKSLSLAIAQAGAASGAVVNHLAASDFNGDGSSDVLYGTDDGLISDLLADERSGFVSNAKFDIQVTSNWHVIGTGDFNGDGRVDLLWRSDDGSVTDWLGQSDGSFINNWDNFHIQADANWQIVGTGDYDGDGISDLLWRSTEGTVTNWLGHSDGSFTTNWSNFHIHADSNWQIVGTHDFDGDGISDIMWRSNDGVLTNWLGQANGAFANNFSNFNVIASSNWQIAGFGDFNGDGRNDILWRSNDGTVSDWLANPNGGFTTNGSNYTIYATSNWHISAIGDYNHDGRSDIFWSSDAGEVSDWFGQANGAVTPSAQAFDTRIDIHTHVIDWP